MSTRSRHAAVFHVDTKTTPCRHVVLEKRPQDTHFVYTKCSLSGRALKPLCFIFRTYLFGIPNKQLFQFWNMPNSKYSNFGICRIQHIYVFTANMQQKRKFTAYMQQEKMIILEIPGKTQQSGSGRLQRRPAAPLGPGVRCSLRAAVIKNSRLEKDSKSQKRLRQQSCLYAAVKRRHHPAR